MFIVEVETLEMLNKVEDFIEQEKEREEELPTYTRTVRAYNTARRLNRRQVERVTGKLGGKPILSYGWRSNTQLLNDLYDAYLAIIREAL